MSTYQRRLKDNYDRKKRGADIRAGDDVFLFNPALKPDEAAKFHISWRGPVQVLGKVSEILFKIEDPANKCKTKIVHFNNLRKFQRFHRENQSEPQHAAVVEDPGDSDSEEENELLPVDPRFAALPQQQAESTASSTASSAVDEVVPREERWPRRIRRPPDRYGNPVVY